MSQFDDRSTLTPFANSFSTLLAEENFLKIYVADFVEVGHRLMLAKHILLQNTVHLASRESLQNLERFDDANEAYTANAPLNHETAQTVFDRHQVFWQRTEIRWQAHSAYEYKRGQWMTSSSAPALTVKYKSAHANILGADLSYQNITVGLEGRIEMGSLGKADLRLEAGDFITKDSLSFVDFTHFQGNRVAYSVFEPGTFQLLDYYSESTSGSYLRGHYLHKFNQLTNHRGIDPFQPVLEANLLLKEDTNYFEIGVGLQGMAKPWRISFHSSWLAGRHDRSELRFGFVLSELQ